MPSITRNFLLLALTGVLIAGIACGGGGDSGSTDGPTGTGVVLSPINSDLLPIVVSSDLAIGDNRFVVGLIDQETNEQVVGADLSFAFYLMDTNEGTLKFEADPEAIIIDRTYTHTHPDGVVETHEAGTVGSYVTHADFDEAGLWGVEVTGTTADGTELEPIRPTFSVNETSFGLAVGDPAPRTVQVILPDVADIKDIDTSQEPIAEQHNMTIADAVTSGKPTVIAIATPAYCETQICGPTKDSFDELYEEYKADANFVHVEPYDIACINRNEFDTFYDCRNPVIDEWRLQSEPWVFIVDADGNIAAKFDGMVTTDEMAEAVDEVLD